MSVQRWHWGKLVIVWAWGGVAAALLLTIFLSAPVEQNPFGALVSLTGAIAILAALTAVTWRWLGGKER